MLRPEDKCGPFLTVPNAEGKLIKMPLPRRPSPAQKPILISNRLEEATLITPLRRELAEDGFAVVNPFEGLRIHPALQVAGVAITVVMLAAGVGHALTAPDARKAREAQVATLQREVIYEQRRANTAEAQKDVFKERADRLQKQLDAREAEDQAAIAEAADDLANEAADDHGRRSSVKSVRPPRVIRGTLLRHVEFSTHHRARHH